MHPATRSCSPHNVPHSPSSNQKAIRSTPAYWAQYTLLANLLKSRFLLFVGLISRLHAFDEHKDTVHIKCTVKHNGSPGKRCDSLTGCCTLKDGHSDQHKDPTKTMEGNGSQTSCDDPLNCLYQAIVLQCVPLFCPQLRTLSSHSTDHF